MVFSHAFKSSTVLQIDILWHVLEDISTVVFFLFFFLFKLISRLVTPANVLGLVYCNKKAYWKKYRVDCQGHGFES